MRVITIIAIGLFLSSGISAQSPTKSFYNSVAQLDHAVKFDMQRPLVKLGYEMIEKHMGDEKIQSELLKLAKHIKRIKLIIIENPETSMYSGKINTLTEAMKKSSYSPLLYLRKGTAKVSIYTREKRSKIKQLVLLIHGGNDGFVMIDMKANAPVEELYKLDLRNSGREELEPNKSFRL